MIGAIISILSLIAAVSVAYLLTVIDSIVHQQLYQFGLRFSYVWASPYWMLLRISLALLMLVAGASSMNIIHFFWKNAGKPEVAEIAEEAKARAEAVQIRAGVPSLFQCTSCKRSITHPLRMLDFHSQRPKMINICPFCNATVVPVSYTYTEPEAVPTEETEEEIEKRG